MLGRPYFEVERSDTMAVLQVLGGVWAYGESSYHTPLRSIHALNIQVITWSQF